MSKPKSRPARWSEACTAALSAITDMIALQDEYESWKGSLPENLSQSALGEKLEAVCDLDLANVLDTIQEAEAMDLPRGFGKD